MDILEGLNDAQREAVLTVDGPLLILAGAGSGKTKALTHRIAYLIAHQSVWPEQILAVTFTNKAAKEMRERLSHLLGQQNTRSFMPWMGTFHGICVRLLRIDGHFINVPSNFVIYDEDDRQGLIKQAMKQLSINDKEIKARTISSAISNAKNELVTPDDFEGTAQFPYQQAIAKVYRRYEEMRKAAGALDFDDLLIETVRLMRDNREVRAKWQDKFRYILIDEYQDTNAAQYALVKFLVNDNRNIAVVGDDWQCLPPGTLVQTTRGEVPVESITCNDRVVAAAGYGKTSDFAVTDTKKFQYKGELIRITLASGREITSTPNHMLFGRWGKTDRYFVYLMYARDRGFRIGIAKGTRFDGKKDDIGLRVRANQERADHMWILRMCEDRATAQYHEALYSYKYGIPMTVFHSYNNRKMAMTQDQLDSLFKEIDTEERSKNLFIDLGLNFDYPHFVPQGTTRSSRTSVAVNLVLFGSKRITKASPWSPSRLSINTIDPDVFAPFQKRGYTVRPGRADTYRCEVHSLDYGAVERALEEMRDELSSEIRIRKYAFMTDKRFEFMPAINILPDMIVPIKEGGEIIEDKVVSVERISYDGYVYDIDVDKVHNYIANDVVVHNSIYSWRGADFTNILNFERDFPGAKVIKLEQNYRSTGSILDAANNVISKNIQRSDKKLWTDAGAGSPVRVHAMQDEAEEAAFVAGAISSQVAIKTRNYSDVAVLYRTNAQSAPLERAFVRFGIKYKIVGGTRFYDRKEVKDILAYLKVAVQSNDRMSFSRIVNVPTRGVGATSLEKFLQWQESSGFDIVAALANVEQSSTITPRAKKSLADLGSILRSIQASLIDKTPSEVIEKLIKRTGYEDYILDGTPQAEDRQENLGALISDAQSFSTIEEFLEEAALLSSTDSAADDNEVTLMTLHAAKGLEFPVVYMVGMEEGILPHARIYEAGPSELEEERRLCYVGMTRAREELHLTYAHSRLTFGDRKYNMASRFISDMGDQILQAPSDNEAGVTYQMDTDTDFYPDELFSEGDRVRSQAFGAGTVIDVDGLALTIEFDKGQTKKLNAEYAHLEKIT